ncbi:hypothetical protein [Cupriavidus necator]|uniref:hypothetical protein n=1 Tax=Cupriavidus necator TaxID=106590 RepID=UPI00277F9DC7|nr:hypothetical protein [Cupriavidus necator]MDQ0140869.1 hypothetical protein [Cupriavidus necator]
MTGAAITYVQLTVPGIAMFGYTVIVLIVLVPRYWLMPALCRRLYGWAAAALAGVLALNLCVFAVLMPARPRLPLDDAFTGACLSLCLSLLLCHRAKVRRATAAAGTGPPAN